MNFPRARLLSLAAALAACNHNVQSPFPKEVGYTPLEPVTDIQLPAGTADDPFPATLVTSSGAGAPDWAHGMGYVHADLAAVYLALHDPAASYIHGTDHWFVTGAVEPEFPISFQVEYQVHDVISVWWDITYRGGPLAGSSDAPDEVGFRYQKTAGTNHVRVQSGSLVARPVAPGVTSLEMVGYIDADRSGASDVEGTLKDWFSDLSVLSGAPAPQWKTFLWR